MSNLGRIRFSIRPDHRPRSDDSYLSTRYDYTGFDGLPVGSCLKMPDEKKLKCLLGSMLGTSVLAASFTALPVSYDIQNGNFIAANAFASEGDSGESGDSGDSGDSGESGDSGDSGESGDSGDSGESGESGDSGENGDSGDDGGSAESGESGSLTGQSKSGILGQIGGWKNKRIRNIPERFGKVLRTKTSGKNIEIRYSDGWREEITPDRYRLKNQFGMSIISRVPKQSDWVRMKKILNRSN